MPDRSYTLFTMRPTMIGGLLPIPAEASAMGARPVWMGYIGVDDVDATAQRVTAAGGAVHRAPEDIPRIGRFAVAADPQGAMFILFRGSSNQPLPPTAPGVPGCIGWHELRAIDGESAFDFYSSLFGWTKTDAIDMGPMGIYQTFSTGGLPVGGVMTKTPETLGPSWLYFVTVDSVYAAMTRVTDAGGQVINGSMQVPGGNWIVHCIDPQGAVFAMIGAKR